jgi:hypothetical protein
MGQFLSACVRPEPVSACSSKHTYADPEVHAQATQIVDILLAAEKPGAELAAQLEDVVHAASWTEYLAAAVVRALCVAIEVGAWLGNAAADAFRRAIEEAYEFGRDHPELVVILALAMLVMLAPFILEMLGFGLLGPVAGECAMFVLKSM